MAQLRDLEVQVDVDRNQSRTGDSGTKVRDSESCYLRVGGSRVDMSVTLNFSTGHFCREDHSGTNCKGNMHGKGQKYGHISRRDTRSPIEWCKHVQAALADTEKVAEAQDLSAQAFGASKPSTVATVRARVKAPVPAFEAPPQEELPLRERLSPAERLEIVEAEAATLRDEIRAENAEALRVAVADLLKVHTYEDIKEALKASPNRY